MRYLFRYSARHNFNDDAVVSSKNFNDAKPAVHDSISGRMEYKVMAKLYNKVLSVNTK